MSEYFAELYLFVVRPLDEEIPCAVLPKRNVLDLREHMITGFRESAIDALNVFYVETEVVVGAVTHGRLGGGNDFDE